jgi:hypothetical protein
LAAFFKAPPPPPAPPAEVKKPDLSPPPPSHTNDLYAMVVDGIEQHAGHIGLEMTLENRSPRDIKIHCRLQDTYVKDASGAEWRQDVSASRDGLCVRGIEQQPGPPLSLHFHETSPRRDAVFSIEGLTLEGHPPATPEERPASSAQP